MTNIAASGIVLEPLTKYNYDTWSILVRNYLVGQGLWEVVANSGLKVSARSNGAAVTWEMKNAKALHVILLACGPENLPHIKDLPTATEAWNYLSGTTRHDSELVAHADIEQGDNSFHYYRSLHRNIMNGKWNDAEVFLHRDETAIYSTDHMGLSTLHLAVIGGNEEIVKRLVDLGGDNLVKMVEGNSGNTALTLVAELSGNINITKCLLENKKGEAIRQDMLYWKAGLYGEIPLLLAAAKGHKEMTSYLYARTDLGNMIDANIHYPALLFRRCITANIFDVALSLVQRFPQMPLAEKSESDGIQPLHALASMPYVFPSGSRYGSFSRFLYKILILPVETSVALQKKQLNASFLG